MRSLAWTWSRPLKYVYRGAESVEDDATQENLSQIRESLEAIGQTVE